MIYRAWLIASAAAMIGHAQSASSAPKSNASIANCMWFSPAKKSRANWRTSRPFAVPVSFVFRTVRLIVIMHMGERTSLVWCPSGNELSKACDESMTEATSGGQPTFRLWGWPARRKWMVMWNDNFHRSNVSTQSCTESQHPRRRSKLRRADGIRRQ